jgi:hypothetical protein
MFHSPYLFATSTLRYVQKNVTMKGMLGAKRGEGLKLREAIHSAIVQQGSSDRAVGGSVKRWLDAFLMLSEY